MFGNDATLLVVLKNQTFWNLIWDWEIMEVPWNLSSDFYDCVPQFSIVVNTGMFFVCLSFSFYIIKFSIVLNTGFTGSASSGKVSKKLFNQNVS